MKRLIAMALSLTMLGGYAVLPARAVEKQTETISYTYDAGRWTTQHREMEKLGRGLVAINTGNGVYLSWRLLDSEDARFGSAESNVSFNVYRDGAKIETVTNKTNCTDSTVGSRYQVAPVVNGVEGDKCDAVSVQNGNYFDIPVQKPVAASLPKYVTENKWNYFVDSTGAKVNPNDWRNENVAYGDVEYTLNDASCGDLDGDGEYEIIVKWDAGGQDNSFNGVTGNVILQAYKMHGSGTPMWTIDLGPNIRAGAHYTQFLVYDFDLDGTAELICKTAPGSKGNNGHYVTETSHVDAINSYTDTDNEYDYRNDAGYILDGDEFLTVFDGKTGNAVDTIYYPNQRVAPIVWGDTYGGRVDRFTATVAYMDGVNPYAVYMRGYYMRQSGGISEREAACAVSYKNKQLSCTHSFDTYNVDRYSDKSSSASYDSNGNYKGVNGYKSGYEIFAGEGNHNCSTADVDNDGKDEVITGANCYEFTNDNSEMVPKWSTFMEHGDALHIGDYDPTHEGFEFFTVHEDSGPNRFTGTKIGYGMSVIDPAVNLTDPDDTDTWNKLVMFHEEAGGDTGRGVMANIGMGGYYQFWSSGNELKISNGGTSFTQGSKNGLSQNFRIFWDGDLYDELLDGVDTDGDVSVTSWNGRRMVEILRSSGCKTSNSTKKNPALTADIFGDWREEIVMSLSDSSALRVYSTTTPTDYKIKTLMHDPVYRMGVSAEQTAYNQPPHVGLYLSTELFAAEPESLAIITPPDKTVYAIGDELDTSGMVVQVTRTDQTKENVTIYSVTGFDSSKSGKQTLTVTYMGVSATFDVTVKSVSSISVTPPTKLTYSIGQDLNTSGMEVTAVYNDNTSSVIPAYSCEVTGYNPDLLGEQTVTVTYAGKKAYFKVTVREPAILLIDGIYETTSTASSHTDIEVGNYSGNFTIEHKVTVNSMPANGNADRRYDNGFFMRFMNFTDGHTGGGWYLTQSGSQAQVVWKNTKTSSVGKIDIGKTYTFRYEFTNVGTGVGATAKLTILDEAGNQVASASNLNLRNFSDTNTGKSAPITSVQIFNQANANSTASVTIAGAIVYDASKITQVSGSDVTVNMASLGNARIFAAKYMGDALSDVQELVPTKLGESTLNANIEPDKVFMWTYDMYPIDVWTKPAVVTPSSYEVSVTVTDADGTPVPNATVRLVELQNDGTGDDDSTGEITLTAVNLSATTDENGVAEFTDVPSGRYRLFAAYDGLGSALQTVSLTSTVSQLSYTLKFKKH